MSAEVFVSYSSQDHAQVSKIIERLRKAGVSVWMDEGGIDAATLRSEAIVEAINGCKVLIMMVSSHSTNSPNVVKEVMLASESGKVILPLYLEEAEIPSRLKYQLTGIQHLEAFALSEVGLIQGLVNIGVAFPKSDRLHTLPATSQATIERVHNASDIVEIIGSYMPLKRAGTNFIGLCPFHKEKTPSFNISPSRQIFHCFGCHKGGDVFTFLREFENLNFLESVQRLAERAGIPIELDLTNAQREEDQREEGLYEKYKSNLLHEQLSKPPPRVFRR